MSAEKALLSVKEVVRLFGDQKAVHSFYIEFRRRLEVLKLVKAYCNPGSTVLDLGAQPFIISCALRKMSMTSLLSMFIRNPIGRFPRLVISVLLGATLKEMS